MPLTALAEYLQQCPDARQEQFRELRDQFRASGEASHTDILACNAELYSDGTPLHLLNVEDEKDEEGRPLLPISYPTVFTSEQIAASFHENGHLELPIPEDSELRVQLCAQNDLDTVVFAARSPDGFDRWTWVLPRLEELTDREYESLHPGLVIWCSLLTVHRLSPKVCQDVACLSPGPEFQGVDVGHHGE